MLKTENIKGIIFDYGGTLDTNSVHWSEVLWEMYQKEQIAVTKEQFRECYVYAERELAKQPLIKPEHNFLDLLRIKVDIETLYLTEHDMWQVEELTRRACTEHVALRSYQRVTEVLKVSREVLRTLSARYPLVLVSNFYGNIHTILQDFRLEYFQDVIESSVVGVRKPDPKIFMMGVEALGLKPEDTVVIGDSFTKDVVPAHQIGCQTIWLKGQGWESEVIDESVPSLILTDIAKLSEYMLK
ncbi:MAG: HAD family hydrolase [Bacteroidaceae bacterium]|nr:HAD family hydrolase [Bacteroidaceae bacterium]